MLACGKHITDTWKCGSFKLYFYPSARGLRITKKQKQTTAAPSTTAIAAATTSPAARITNMTPTLRPLITLWPGKVHDVVGILVIPGY